MCSISFVPVSSLCSYRTDCVVLFFFALFCHNGHNRYSFLLFPPCSLLSDQHHCCPLSSSHLGAICTSYYLWLLLKTIHYPCVCARVCCPLPCVMMDNGHELSDYKPKQFQPPAFNRVCLQLIFVCWSDFCVWLWVCPLLLLLEALICECICVMRQKW